MPFADSPGWERQWHEHPWTWDFEVSTVSEGHRVVKDEDKNQAKKQGAKLTFGEVLDCGVSLMLKNLGASHKRTFHDLGMGPGKMLIQSYLQFFNLKVCMGVELAKGRYDLAEQNLKNLLKVGWRGRKFKGVEIKSGEYLKIVELVNNKNPKTGWKVGDECIAFYPFLKQNKNQKIDYLAKITEISVDKNNNKKYTVKYRDEKNGEKKNIQEDYIFIPGTERTCEVWYGSLFDYPNGFDAELCVLETDFPEEMHPQLIKCMSSGPIGCTFLTYHDLKKFKCFDWSSLRQIDVNIYDNDRYITSWSQGWRFYLWEHIDSYEKSYKDLNKNIFDLSLNSGLVYWLKTNTNIKYYGELKKYK